MLRFILSKYEKLALTLPRTSSCKTESQRQPRFHPAEGGKNSEELEKHQFPFLFSVYRVLLGSLDWAAAMG